MSFPFHIICIRAPLSHSESTFIEHINSFWVELCVCSSCCFWWCLFRKTKRIRERGSQNGSWNVWNANSKKHLNRLFSIAQAKNQTPAIKDNNTNHFFSSEREAKNNRQTETIGGKKLNRSLECEMKRLILLFERKMSIVSFLLPPRTKNSVDSFHMQIFAYIYLVVYWICISAVLMEKDRQEEW